jgi:hypothetical protein
MAYPKADVAESLQALKELLPNHADEERRVIYCVYRDRRKSGSARIEFYAMGTHGMRRLTLHMARVLGRRCNDHGLLMPYINMDQSFECLHSLGRHLGYEIQERYMREFL